MWYAAGAFTLLIVVMVVTISYGPSCAPEDHSGTYAAGMLMKGCK